MKIFVAFWLTTDDLYTGQRNMRTPLSSSESRGGSNGKD